MADPFSIATGVVGLLDVTARLIKYIWEIQRGFGTIDMELQGLAQELESLERVGQHMKQYCRDHGSPQPSPNSISSLSSDFSGQTLAAGKAVNIASTLEQTSENCKHVVVRLRTLIEEIYGKSGSTTKGFRDVVAKTIRNKARQSEISGYRSQIILWQSSIQLLMKISTSLVTESF